MAETHLTPTEIRKLWQNSKFSQSYTGLGTFRDALRTERNFYITLTELRDIMLESTAYLDWIRRQKRRKTRPLQTDGYRELVQIDLAHFFDYQGYKYALIGKHPQTMSECVCINSSLGLWMALSD